MLQKETTLPADTFTTKPDKFKTIGYRVHQRFEIGRKATPVYTIRSFNDRAHFYPMLIVASVTSRSNDVRSTDAGQR